MVEFVQQEAEDAEVMAAAEEVARAVTARLADELTRCAPDAASIRARIAEVLAGDEGARLLLGAAYAEGYSDCATHRGEAVQAPEAAGVATWQDVQSVGERRAIHREEHLCGRCVFSPMCAVARAAPPEALVLVKRCLHFTPRPGAR